jgi:AcrR family transcriptional regulator
MAEAGARRAGASKAPIAAPSETREFGAAAAHILETAERLCGERGLESVSIRDIAKAANVSIAVIYHHFGSKSNLLRTLLRTRLAEIGRIRAARFAELEAEARPQLRPILRALFEPVARLRAPGAGRQATMQFLARALVSTVPEVKEETDATVLELRRVVHLLERALPQLSHREICWRLHFTFGIEHMTHWDDARLAILSEGDADGADLEDSIARAVAYAEAAFTAPALESAAGR